MKKTFSLLLTLVLALNLVTINVVATEGTVTISVTKTENPKTLQATASITNAVSYEYQWVERSAPTENYTEVPTDIHNTYIVSPRDKNMYLNCRVTPVFGDGSKGEAIYASSDTQITSLGRFSRSDSTVVQWPETTPSEYLFTVDGQSRKYILLDYFLDKDASFYVMQDSTYGTYLFDTQEGHTRFDPTCSTNIGYALNSEDFKNNGLNGVKFNATIMNYIDWDHVWWTEQGISSIGNGYSANADYSFTAGLSLLSMGEAYKYREKIGWNLQNLTWWWTRTQRGLNYANHNIITMKGSGEFWNISAHVKESNSQIPSIRPTFYLNEDFFREVRLKLQDSDGSNLLGESVQAMLKSRYTRDELSAIYSDKELDYIGFSAPDYVTIDQEQYSNGSPIMLTANLTVENAVSYQYQWIARAGVDGAYSDIRSDKQQKYFVSTLDKNKYLNCKVTPVFADGSLGASSISKTDYYVGQLGRYSRSDSSKYPFPATTPAEYKFKVTGQSREYILLDEFNDSESAFYIMQEDSYGRYMFDTEGHTRFEPDCISNVGYAINSDDFKNSGLNGVMLNNKIKEHIDWDHVWWTESGAAGGDAAEDYSFTAGMSLISITEAYKYSGKFGYNLHANNSWWWTRTQRGVNGNTTNIMVMKGAGEFWNINASTLETSGQIPCVRSTFYLNDDFFKSVKIYDIGDSVKETILNRYSKSELVHLYNEKELEDIGYPAAISLDKQAGNLYYQKDLKVMIDYTPSAYSYIEIIAKYNGTETMLYDDFGYSDIPIKGQYNLASIPFGTQDVSVVIKENDVVMATMEQSIYVIPDAENAYGQSRMGMVVPIAQILAEPNIIENVKRLGFNNIRVEFTWDRIEQQQGEYSFDLFAPVMNKARECDVDILALFAYNSSIYSSNTGTKEAIDTPEERTAFANYVKAVVEEYPEIKNIEIWNEPNAPGFWNNGTGAITANDIADYSLLVKQVSDVLKSVSPDINVFAGAIDVSKDALNYVNGMLANGVYPYMDVLSYHPYYHPNNVNTAQRDGFIADRILPYKNVLRNYGGFKQLAATELGFSSGLFTSVGVTEQTREVPKEIIVSAANHIEMGQVFNYKDTVENFGILDVDGIPTPLMYSLAQMNHVLNGAVFIGQLETVNKIRAYVFARNGEPVIAAWATENTTFNITGVDAKAYDLNGNPVAISNSALTLTLNPTYIEKVDSSYFESANLFERAKRKQMITATELPQNIIDALNSDSVALKSIIDESSLTDLQKSTLLDMIHEVELVDAAYQPLSGLPKTEIPLGRYNMLKASADNAYAKAALKYAERYIREGQAVQDSDDVSAELLTKNIIVAEKLLDSVEILISGAADDVAVQNISKLNNMLTFEVVNNTSKALEVYVAIYDSKKLVGVQIADLSNLSFNVGSANGKIMVWEQGTMTPLTRLYDF